MSFLTLRGARAVLDASREGRITCAPILLPWERSSRYGCGPDVVAGIVGLEVDGAESSILLEVSRAIFQQVLAAQLFLNSGEAGAHVLDAVGIEGPAASGVGDGLQHIASPAVLAGADVGRDRIDDGFCPLAFLDGVRLPSAWLWLSSPSRDQDDRPCVPRRFLQRQHLVLAGGVERVEQPRVLRRGAVS